MTPWHPFLAPTKGLEVPVVASALSPAIGATLAVVKEADGIHLASFRLETGKAHCIPVSDGAGYAAHPAARIETGGDRFVVRLFGLIYVGSLKSLRPAPGFPFHHIVATLQRGILE